MKKFYSILIALAISISAFAQTSPGWSAQYKGVLLQGFSWDSYADTQWTKLESQADELSQYFNLIWVPQSGNCNTTSNVMGYMPVYYFNQNSSFGTEAELRSMINTFKSKGTGIMADVVVNHRNNLGVNGSWVDYPAEIYNGVTYQMTPQDITNNDDGGSTRNWATTKGITLSANNDEGEDWNGCRDLDHKSLNVQNIIKAYTKYLVQDLGYTGFRYDMVKGFNANHVGDYNDAAGVQYSVGEYWSSASDISNWITNTNYRSGAFDFQFRYAVRDAINNNNWTLLGNNQYLVNNNFSSGSFKRYAVTFVENHDMQDRGTTQGYTPDPILKDTLAANAFLLAMPGTPCVFLPHWKACKQDIKLMIDARKAVGISNTSVYTQLLSLSQRYAVKVTGDNGELVAVVGPLASGYPPSSDVVEIINGYHYRYFVTKASEMVFADKASGKYDTGIIVKLTAASNDANAQVVYTLDGTTPTVNSTKVASGSLIPVNATSKLTLGLLSNGTVTKIVTRDYTIGPASINYETPPRGYTYHAYFIAPSTWDIDTRVYAWAWIDKGANYTPDNNATWPGDKVHVYRIGKASTGGYVWEWCYYGTQTVPPAYIIFNNGNSGVGTNQTANMVFTDGGWYNMNTTSSNPTLDIQGISSNAPTNNLWYTITGIAFKQQPTQKGIYIHNGKKMIIR